MKIKRILATILTGVVLFTGTGVSTASASITSQSLISETKNTPAESVKWPSGPEQSKLSCDSAIVMELSTGSILYKKNIHKQHYPASITKILTAMLTVENCALSETVTFSEKAVYGIEPGSSTIYSDVGEKMTIEQCLYAIMLESANEVCLGVGEHISGSISKFVDLMNARVKELGLKNTHFNNPNGLPDPKHYTTAYDMAVIAREAMKNSAFHKIAGTRTYTMAKTNTHKETRVWNNHHQMINGYKYPQYEYKYSTGGKTGYTDAARNTLVTYAEKDGMELVCVIMRADGPQQGEPNEYTDTSSLLNFGFEKYKKYTIDKENSRINESLFNNYDSFFNTEESPLHLAGESTVVLPKGVKLSQAEQKITYNKTALQEGENVIGKVTYTYGGKTVGSTDILYNNTENSSHLDEASRKLVNSEIEDIKNSNEKNKKAHQKLAQIGKSITGFFAKAGSFLDNQLVTSIIILAAGLLILFVLAMLLWRFTLNRPKRLRGRHGGYRSKGGKRHHARITRERRQQAGSEKRNRRNHSKHYEKPKTTSGSGRKRSTKGVQYHKRHKRTKESFGRNFFDF